MTMQFEIIEKSNLVILAAQENNRIVGSVRGIVCKELHGTCAPFLVVENRIVDPLHRKRHIGSRFLSELERQANARRCPQMILIAEAGRLEVGNFDGKHGFETSNKGYKKKL